MQTHELSRSDKLNHLKRFLQSNEPMLLMLDDSDGPNGTESHHTELLDDLVESVKISRYLIRLSGSKTIRPDQLVRLLSKHWSAQGRRHCIGLKNQLDDFVMGLSEHDQSCVLIVEDAHSVSLSVLAAFIHLSIYQERQKNRITSYIIGS